MTSKTHDVTDLARFTSRFITKISTIEDRFVFHDARGKPMFQVPVGQLLDMDGAAVSPPPAANA